MLTLAMLDHKAGRMRKGFNAMFITENIVVALDYILTDKELVYMYDEVYKDADKVI